MKELMFCKFSLQMHGVRERIKSIWFGKGIDEGLRPYIYVRHQWRNEQRCDMHAAQVTSNVPIHSLCQHNISYTLRSWRRDRLKCLTIPSPWWSSVGRGLGYQISEKPNNCGNHKWKKHQNCPHESTATPQCSKLYLISRGRITYSENGMLPQLTTCTYPLPHQSCQDIIHRDSGVHLIVFNFKA